MKKFKDFILEMESNNATKKWRGWKSPLGLKPHVDAKHHSTLDNGDRVFHRSVTSDHGLHHHYYVVGKSGKTNISLTTHQKPEHKAEDIVNLTANKASKGAHHLYQHLVTKHNKIFVGSSQSPGARKVWDKVSKHPKINIHGWDGSKPVHAHPSEDEHYVHYKDYKGHGKDYRKAKRAKNIKAADAHKADLDHLDYIEKTHLVMHKK